VPPILIPPPPKLLPVTDVSSIAWQGSVGAVGYDVERAPENSGPWTKIADNVDECFTQYRPQSCDESAPQGKWFYRVRAKNNSGVSEPSNVVGPVNVSHVTLVDELADFSKASSIAGELTIESRDCRAAMEDAHRAAGKTGSWLTYQIPTPMSAARVFTFFPKQIADLQFSVSTDGQTFKPATSKRTDFPFKSGDYGYWRRAVYEVSTNDVRVRFLKIEFTGEAQVSRVEIRRKADAQ
jgi:mannan endo-1,4-beta-mannosidase